MIQSVSFTSGTLEAFAKTYLWFLVSVSAKNAEVMKFLGILKKYVSEKKIYFCSRKKSNFLLNKKVTFVFHTIFNLDFIEHIIYTLNYPQMSVFSFHTFLFCYISL